MPTSALRINLNQRGRPCEFEGRRIRARMGSDRHRQLSYNAYVVQRASGWAAAAPSRAAMTRRRQDIALSS